MVEAAGVTDANTSGTGLSKLVTDCDWESVIGDPADSNPNNYEYADRNQSGFSALPAGEWNEGFFAIGKNAEFWTATKGSTGAWYRGFGAGDGGTHRADYQLDRGYSVRCVRDN